MRTLHPHRAVAAAAFYAWNPFVLFESVASAHNDAVLVVFLCAVVWAFGRQRWAACGALLGCAVMVKPFALLAVAPLAAAMGSHQTGVGAVHRLLIAGFAGTSTVAALYLPFNAGDAFVRNALANPASGTYMNSVWELVAVHFGGWSGLKRIWVQTTWLDPARVALLAVAILAGTGLSWRTRRVVPGIIVLWTGFCLSQAWVWPWYFLPIVAMASFAGAGAQRLAIALSLGGLFFYLAWPPPPKALAWIYQYRSLLLFGPLAAALIVEALARYRMPPPAGAAPTAPEA
jgi:hypothetical protein